MKPITFVICAAGRGERFRQHGMNIPKPLIKINGKSMLERSIDSLERTKNDQLIIITQQTDNLPQAFSHLQNIEWLEINGTTKGQLDTFLLARDLIKHDEIVIYNCDTYFTAPGLRELIDSGKFSGIIPCSIQPGLSWSFCQKDEADNVLKVAEKERISDWASVGYYYFQGKETLFHLAEIETQQSSSKETYVAPLYNRYLQRGLKVCIARVETFLPFGTIEQVKDYWDVSFEDLINQNN